MARFLCACVLCLCPFFAWCNVFVSSGNGSWSASSTWGSQYVPSPNINNKDTVIIQHAVDAEHLKVHNGGVVYVRGSLKVKQLTITGRTSQVHIARGAILEVEQVQGNWENIYQEVLPVTWLDFTYTSENKGHLLAWSTAQEVNNDYIALEYSDESLSFKEINRQPGTNTNHPAYYSFFFSTPAKGTSYYRLKQVDFDGTVSYSKIISATQHGFNYQLTATSLQLNTAVTGIVSLIRADGSSPLVKTMSNQSSLAFPALPVGVYLLKIVSPQHTGIYKTYLSD